ncbi:MAG: rod shape-determining protein MreC [Gemmatimonadales bacterium]|nr:rod shape-determining protein MreC [Gemmatimonadales bacterium]
MPIGVDRPEARRDAWLPLVCIGLAVAALFLPARIGYDVAAALRAWSPLRALIWLQEQAVLGRTSAGRFAVVTAQRDSAILAARRADQLDSENRRLRLLLGLGDRLATPFVTAEVLRQELPTDGRTLLVSAGGERGVRIFQPALAPEGMVGMVRTIAPGSAVVMTWAHPEFRASAVTEDGRLFGIVAASGGRDGTLPEMVFRTASYRDTIPQGALILTSGLGGVFPSGVPVGRVAGLAREQKTWERVYRLVPTANLGTVDHLLLLQRDSAAVPAAIADSAFRRRQEEQVREEDDEP